MAVLTTLTERSLSGELCTLIISVSFPFPNERYQLISQRRRDVGEFCGGKTGECVVCCHRCGAFLMESASTTSYMVCPECGARLVVCVKKGKVSVFDDTRYEEELAKKRHARLTRYSAKINEIVK